MAHTQHLPSISNLPQCFFFPPSDIQVSENPLQHFQHIHQASPTALTSAPPVGWLPQRKLCNSTQSSVSASTLCFLTRRRCISTPLLTAQCWAGSQEYSINYITPLGASLTWKCRRRIAKDSNNEKPTPPPWSCPWIMVKKKCPLCFSLCT